MQNATNNLNNIGKPVEEQQFLLLVSYRELWALKGLTQNPHESHMVNEQMVEVVEPMFRDLRFMLDVINDARTDQSDSLPMQEEKL